MLSPYASVLAHRWARESPDTLRQFEAGGRLVPALKKLAEEEALNEWRARLQEISRRADPSPATERS